MLIYPHSGHPIHPATHESQFLETLNSSFLLRGWGLYPGGLTQNMKGNGNVNLLCHQVKFAVWNCMEKHRTACIFLTLSSLELLWVFTEFLECDFFQCWQQFHLPPPVGGKGREGAVSRPRSVVPLVQGMSVSHQNGLNWISLSTRRLAHREGIDQKVLLPLQSNSLKAVRREWQSHLWRTAQGGVRPSWCLWWEVSRIKDVNCPIYCPRVL